MIQFRDAVGADATRLFELDRICFPAEIAYSLGEFRSLIRSRTTICVVAEDDGVLAGFCAAQQTRINNFLGGHIVTIDVAPAFRRRGLGHLLMENVTHRVGGSGGRFLRLEVAVDNHDAERFYRGLGFEAIGRIDDYYGVDLDAIVMERSLGMAGN